MTSFKVLFSLLLLPHAAELFEISGKVSIEGTPPRSFPKDSWLVVKVRDITAADGASRLLGEYVQKVEGTFSLPFTYTISNNIRLESSPMQDVTVSAVINVGWEANGDNWIRFGDYVTDSFSVLNTSNGSNKFVMDLTVIKL